MQLTASQRYTPSSSGLPDPTRQPEFYQDVPTKRLIAWFVDTLIIGLIVSVVAVLTAFTALIFLPLWMVVSFFYRWLTIANRSATPGMRLAAIELRRADGSAFDNSTALLHTAGYIVSVVTFPLQLISIVLMLMSEKKQGLTDMVLGTAALNREAAPRY